MAGGILLSLRQKETILILNVLNHIFTLFGNLSRYFQTEDHDLSNLVLFTESTITSLENLDSFQECVEKTDKIVSTLKESGEHVNEKENIKKSVKSMLLQYVNKLCQNLRTRFNPKAMNYLKCYKLFTKQTSTSTSGPAINYNAYIEELPISADNKSALLLELPVFRRWIDNMKVTSLQDVMMEVITGASEIFPAFSTLAVKLLVAPVGTASVERSFSNLNRILTNAVG
ncbi:zinc finger protein 862 [Biomphalaria pfeifferi]|uniref:Zinc finger protein 862 n=1 Tax=Biomphalaria pfeifferi TaxID=112525 RepID=A0AAD8C794_BIOPF|nr:zinc finger protein 862 [Biomphalaria pfeifferi]